MVHKWDNKFGLIEDYSDEVKEVCKNNLLPNGKGFVPDKYKDKIDVTKEGIKYDQDKPRIAEMIIDFAPALEELCKVWEFGANKYSKSNWKLVDNGIDRYTNALVRHLIQEDTNLYDDESGLLHASHIAFNALARLHFLSMKNQEKVIKTVPGAIYEIT